jgi:hypothetical protein
VQHYAIIADTLSFDLISSASVEDPTTTFFALAELQIWNLKNCQDIPGKPAVAASSPSFDPIGAQSSPFSPDLGRSANAVTELIRYNIVKTQAPGEGRMIS